MEKNRNKEFFFNKLYHLFFSEKFSKKINYNFDKKNRLDLINFVIKKNKYKKYLEIGCNQDEVFKKIVIDKIGVDPVNGGNFRGTSDDFFIKNSDKFDCIFIDGLHIYDQVKKDILNSIKVLNENGILLCPILSVFRVLVYMCCKNYNVSFLEVVFIFSKRSKDILFHIFI